MCLPVAYLYNLIKYDSYGPIRFATRLQVGNRFYKSSKVYKTCVQTVWLGQFFWSTVAMQTSSAWKNCQPTIIGVFAHDWLNAAGIKNFFILYCRREHLQCHAKLLPSCSLFTHFIFFNLKRSKMNNGDNYSSSRISSGRAMYNKDLTPLLRAPRNVPLPV